MREEFSLPGKEIAPPPEEFSRPRAEFAPQGREYSVVGEEFEQTSRQNKKEKKRRISPLMMTAAAVTTAAVAISGVGHHSYQRYPEWKLNAEQCAYLDEVWQELREQDGVRLAELSAQPILEQIYREVLFPYAEMLERDYGEDVIYNDETGEEYISHALSYDGESICFGRDGVDEWFWLHYERDIHEGNDGSIVFDDTHVHFDSHDDYDMYERSDGYSFWSRYNNLKKQIETWDVEYEEGYVGLAPDGERYWIKESGHRESWYLDSYYANGEEVALPLKNIIEGEITQEWIEPEDGTDPYYMQRLENGTVDRYVQLNGTWLHAGRVEVVDGMIQLTDQMHVEQSGEYYWVIMTSDTVSLPGYASDDPNRPYTWTIAGGEAESAEEVLCHSEYIHYW